MTLLLSSPAHAACSNPSGDAGDVIYNNDENVLSYCDDTDWIAIRGSGTRGYIPNAVQFDGTNDHFVASSALSITPQISKQGTFSFWFKRDASAGAQTFLTLPNLSIKWVGSSQNIAVLGGPANGDVLRMDTTGLAGDSTKWHHVMMSWDLTNTGKRHVYLDGVSAIAITNYNNTDLNMTAAPQTGYFGVNSAILERYSGYVADFWFDFGTYIDLSVAANRRKFIDATGNPVYLGANGELPTGTAPDIFLSGNTANWHTNKGTGSGFTENGTLTTAATAPGELDTSLVGWWKLDETSGTTAVDSSGNGNDGTLGGGGGIPTWDTGVINGGVRINGGNSNITVTQNASINDLSELTFTAWVKGVSGGGANLVFKDNDFYIVGNVTNNWLQFNAFWDGTYGQWRTPDNTVSDTTWHHVAVTYNFSSTANDPVIYIDGTPVSLSEISTPSGNALASTANLIVGNNGALSNAWNNQIDDVRIYNRALTASEIQSLAAVCEEGNMIYNADHHVPQYCAGNDDWVAMGPVRDGIDSGLAGHWKLDETAGTNVSDSSGNGNTGTFSGDTSVNSGTGKVSTALDFDKVNDVISVPADPTIDNIFNGGGTWAAWIYPRSTGEGSYGRIINKGSHSFHFMPAGVVRLETIYSGNDGLWVTNSALNMNEWNHVAVTYDNTLNTNDPVIYVNGAAAAATENSTPLGTQNDDSASPLLIGNTATNDRTFDGYIDDVRAYNRILSPAEIQALYKLGNDNDGSLVGHWKLDETSGTTAVDSSGSSNDGTFQSPSSGSTFASNTVTAVNGRGLKFADNNDRIDVSSADFAATNFTFSAWVKQNVVMAQNTFFELGNLELEWSGARLLIRADGGNHLDSNDSHVPGWNHIVLTYDGTTFNAYQNNVLEHSATDTFTNNNNMGIGGDYGGGRELDGEMDDVRFYTRALSATEINALYKMGTGNCTNPVGKEGDLIYNDDAGVKALTYCDGANWQMSGKSQ